MASNSKPHATRKLHAARQNQRRSLSAGDLSDAELKAIASAEIPAAERYRVADIRPKRKR